MRGFSSFIWVYVWESERLAVQKVKGAEERMEACANESQRRVSQLASALPKPAAGAWSDQAAAATADA